MAEGSEKGVSLTPVSTVSCWSGCNINAGRERKRSSHGCAKALEEDPLQSLVWEREGTHIYTYVFSLEKKYVLKRMLKFKVNL